MTRREMRLALCVVDIGSAMALGEPSGGQTDKKKRVEDRGGLKFASVSQEGSVLRVRVSFNATKDAAERAKAIADWNKRNPELSLRP